VKETGAQDRVPEAPRMRYMCRGMVMGRVTFSQLTRRSAKHHDLPQRVPRQSPSQK